MRVKTFPCSLACRYYSGCCSAGSRSSDSDPEKQSLTVCFPSEHRAWIAKVSQEIKSSGKYLYKVPFSDIANANYFNIVKTKACVWFARLQRCCCCLDLPFAFLMSSALIWGPDSSPGCTSSCEPWPNSSQKALPWRGYKSIGRDLQEVASSTSIKQAQGTHPTTGSTGWKVLFMRKWTGLCYIPP